MWSLIKKLLTLVMQFGIDLDDLVKIVKDLTSLPAPPSVSDEEDFRKWVCEVLHTFVGIAEQTPTKIDDGVLKLLDDAVENDTVWPMIYGLLKTVFNRDSIMAKSASAYYGNGEDFAVTEQELRQATDILSAADPGVKTEAELAEGIKGTYGAINPATVVMIASALYELYKILSDKKPEATVKAPVKKAKRKAAKPETEE